MGGIRDGLTEGRIWSGVTVAAAALAGIAARNALEAAWRRGLGRDPEPLD